MLNNVSLCFNLFQSPSNADRSRGRRAAYRQRTPGFAGGLPNDFMAPAQAIRASVWESRARVPLPQIRSAPVGQGQPPSGKTTPADIPRGRKIGPVGRVKNSALVKHVGTVSDETRTDVYSPAKRSEVMRSVKGKNTRVERHVRSVIHRLGFRFRLHAADLPGCPDVVLPRHRKVIFINGCFWHQHPGCPRSKQPQTRADWWRSKLERNVKRDRDARRRLAGMGWEVLVIWECETRDDNALTKRLCVFMGAQVGGRRS